MLEEPNIINLTIIRSGGNSKMSSYSNWYFPVSFPSVEEVQHFHEYNRKFNEMAHEQRQWNIQKRNDMIIADAYRNRMTRAIEDAVAELINNPEKYCSQLNLSMKESLMANEYYGNYFHIVHYGGKPLIGPYGPEWTNRIANPLFVSLFKELQMLMMARGYYLLDISDPSKGCSLIVRLYLGKPEWYDNTPMLWHGLNKI